MVNYHSWSYGHGATSKMLYAGGAGVTYIFAIARDMYYALDAGGSVGRVQDSYDKDQTRVGFGLQLKASIYFDLLARQFSSYSLIGR